MNQKTQVFTEQQLKDLVNGLDVVTCDSVKKGEFVDLIEHNNNILRVSKKVSKSELPRKWKTIFKVGELVQAVNEKGEKQYYCSECNEIRSIVGIKTEICFECYAEYPIGHPLNEIKIKPLLFRLGKIEDTKLSGESTSMFCMANSGKETHYFIKNKEVKSNAKIGEEFWFKTWRMQI